MEIKLYEDKYRDDMIFMVLQAKDALGRIPRLNEDLLDIKAHYISYSLVKYLDRDTPEYVPSNNSGARFKVSLGSEDDADVIENGIETYSEAYEQECENVGFYKKLADKDGRFMAGVIADAGKGADAFVEALFVEEPLRRQGLGTYLLKEVEEFAKENGASMILTNAGDWNVDLFKKNGYLVRGELKDVPKGHNCYELYKMI